MAAVAWCAWLRGRLCRADREHHQGSALTPSCVPALCGADYSTKYVSRSYGLTNACSAARPRAGALACTAIVRRTAQHTCAAILLLHTPVHRSRLNLSSSCAAEVLNSFSNASRRLLAGCMDYPDVVPALAVIYHGTSCCQSSIVTIIPHLRSITGLHACPPSIRDYREVP